MSVPTPPDSPEANAPGRPPFDLLTLLTASPRSSPSSPLLTFASPGGYDGEANLYASRKLLARALTMAEAGGVGGPLWTTDAEGTIAECVLRAGHPKAEMKITFTLAKTLDFTDFLTKALNDKDGARQ